MKKKNNEKKKKKKSIFLKSIKSHGGDGEGGKPGADSRTRSLPPTHTHTHVFLCICLVLFTSVSLFPGVHIHVFTFYIFRLLFLLQCPFLLSWYSRRRKQIIFCPRWAFLLFMCRWWWWPPWLNGLMLAVDGLYVIRCKRCVCVCGAGAFWWCEDTVCIVPDRSSDRSIDRGPPFLYFLRECRGPPFLSRDQRCVCGVAVGSPQTKTNKI